jgi:hypothetical protein
MFSVTVYTCKPEKYPKKLESTQVQFCRLVRHCILTSIISIFVTKLLQILKYTVSINDFFR